jgi:hypothetical protein
MRFGGLVASDGDFRGQMRSRRGVQCATIFYAKLRIK